MSSSTGQRAPRTRAAKAGQGAGGTTTWTPQDQSVDPSYRPTTTAGPTSACSGGGSSCVLSKLIQLPAAPLSRHQLKKLEEHRYSSAGHSLLEPFMQHYWEWLVARVPAWIAPNLITIVGLATNILTTLVLVYYCPTATEQVGPCRGITGNSRPWKEFDVGSLSHTVTHMALPPTEYAYLNELISRYSY